MNVAFLEKHPKFVKSGWLFQQSGLINKYVYKRYCILFGNELFYFKQIEDPEHMGSITLTKSVTKTDEPVCTIFHHNITLLGRVPKGHLWKTTGTQKLYRHVIRQKRLQILV
jgi:hypothetical protein